MARANRRGPARPGASSHTLTFLKRGSFSLFANEFGFPPPPTMPKALTSRHPLPTSSTDFNLPSSTAAPTTSAGSYLEDANVLFQRFRRPSLLAPKAAHLSDSRLHSPLTASFKPPSPHRRRASQSASIDETDSLWFDISTPSSSENSTPPITENTDDTRRSAPPSTPPRRSLSRGADLSDIRMKGRRLSFPNPASHLTRSSYEC